MAAVPSCIQSPCYPIHAVLRRFELRAGSNGGVGLQRIGPPSPPQPTHKEEDGHMELVLFPCQLGAPTRPIGWPPAALHECTVMVNQVYVNETFPRCPTRRASHRTLSGLPLSPYMRLRDDGSIDVEAPLKIVVASKATWTATFLLAWCRAIDVHTVIENTITWLMRAEGTGGGAGAPSSLSLSCASDVDGDDDDGSNESDVDVDSGWVDDDTHAKNKKKDNKDDLTCDRDAEKQNASKTRSLFPAETLKDDNNDEGLLDDGEALVTLRCPLSYKRMQLPVKGKHCSHLGCFDCTTFLESSLRSSAWNCPICDGPVYINDIRVDKTLQRALKELDDEEDTVVLFGAGHREWRAVSQHDNDSMDASSKKSKESNGERAARGNQTSASGVGRQMQPDFCVVDDDDDNDDKTVDAVVVAWSGGGKKRNRDETA